MIHDTDNIGLDTIGWETGTSQASHGYVTGNTVYNVDTWSNAAYGKWSSGTCVARPENAAGIYDDGASYIWIDGNTVWNTDQGINLDVETAGKETDHLLVSGNTVHADPGTSKSDPSTGTNPPGTRRHLDGRRPRPVRALHRRVRQQRQDHRRVRARQHADRTRASSS